jgi:hypothetical protein
MLPKHVRKLLISWRSLVVNLTTKYIYTYIYDISLYSYALEGHFVNFKSSYGTVADAAVHPDGLAVVGLMFEVNF